MYVPSAEYSFPTVCCSIQGRLTNLAALKGMDLTKMFPRQMQKANSNIMQKDAEIHVVETNSTQAKELHSTSIHFVSSLQPFLSEQGQ